MKLPVIAYFSTPLTGLLCTVCAFLTLLGSLASAAELSWQALPDRERITIVMKPSEGMAGKVARIAPTGVLIPFSDVPPGLLLSETPEGAAIFKHTLQQGRSLVLVTQNPEFGFVVSKQQPTEIAIDFFHNALGARWKPTSAAPTTEVAPEHALGPVEEADSVTRALESDPQGQSAASAALAASAAAKNSENTVPPAENGVTPTASQSASSQGLAPNTANATLPADTSGAKALPGAEPLSAPGAASDRPKPVVVELSGSPEHAAKATSMAQAPPAAIAPSAAVPQAVAGAANATQSFTAPQPVLDARTQTAQRAAPLPLPEPPMLSGADSAGQASAAQASAAQASAGQIDFSSPAPSPETNAPSRSKAASEAAVVSDTVAAAGRESAPAAAPAVPAHGPQSGTFPAQPSGVPSAAEPQQAPVPKAAAGPVPGVGQRLGAAQYGGSINLGGMEDIGTSATQGSAPEVQGSAPQVHNLAPGAQQATSGVIGDVPSGAQHTASGVIGDAPSEAQAAPSVANAVKGAFEARPAASSVQGSIDGGDIQGSATQGAAQASGSKALEPPVPPQTNATVIYTDAEGNPVEPPPDPVTLIPQLREIINQGKFQDALDLAELLLEKSVLDKNQKEELLHIRAEMLFAVHKDDFATHYTDIADAANQAMSFNTKSPRNAADLLRLGYMNLKLGNIPEAEARFNMLRRLFPDNDNVPLTYYYWGDYHFGRNELQKAADEFQYVLQEYPNSRYARESALGLARSFYRMGYYDQAFNVVDYIERRWERFYVEYPPFLNMMGDVAFRLDRLDYALRHYWVYVNIEPKGDEADIILTRMGDIYAMQREKAAAQELYQESMNRFPDKDGGLVAMMRLAEEGMYDDPTIAGMFAVYDGPFSMRPLEVYKTIIEKHSQSTLVPLVKVKLALWHLWNKEYEETLKVLSDFIASYPKHELVPRAREIAMQAFSVLAAESMQDERYNRMRQIWESYPIVRDQGEIITPESRIALAVSYRHDGRANEALRAVEPFFLGNKVPEYSEMALSLVLSIYLEHNQWAAVREVARRVDLWELKPESRMQLDYALALAAENMGEPENAAPLWQKLYDSGELPPSQMAYAAFFLARQAEHSRELEKAFLLGQEALSRLLVQVERSPNAADVGKIQTQLASLMDVAESAGRMSDALRYGEQYLQYLAADNPERMAVQYRMARIYKKQGDADTWAKMLQAITAADPQSVYGQLAASELKAASIAEDAARFSPTGRL